MQAEFRSGMAPHFVETIRQTLVKKMEKYGLDIYRDGLRVFTTLDSRMQRMPMKQWKNIERLPDTVR